MRFKLKLQIVAVLAAMAVIAVLGEVLVQRAYPFPVWTDEMRAKYCVGDLNDSNGYYECFPPWQMQHIIVSTAPLFLAVLCGSLLATSIGWEIPEHALTGKERRL